MEVRQQLGWGIDSKTKAQNPKQGNIFKFMFFESQAADL